MLDLVITALAAALFIWLLSYCLRMGVVGGGKGWQKDAHRKTQPIRFWTGIATLTVGAVFSVGGFIYIAVGLLR